MPKSPFCRQAGAVGGHPTQTIICAVYPRSHRAPALVCALARKIREEDANETSTPQFLHLAHERAALPAVSQIAWAQAYPARPVRIIVAFAPGGTFDIMARLIGQWLSERLGQPFVIENRSGGGSNIGTEAVVRAPADGYTLLLVGTANAINATLYEKLNFNFIRDIVPVAGIARVPEVMVANPLLPATTVPEVIAYAKANPGKLTMASGGIGTLSHVVGELFKMMTGVNLVHVPYRGLAPALTDLLGGQVQVMFASMSSSMESVRTGKLRALAVTTKTRSEALPRPRPWLSSCRAARRAGGSASARPRTHPPKSSRSSTRRSTLASPIPR